jgi:hypothetical protein
MIQFLIDICEFLTNEVFSLKIFFILYWTDCIEKECFKGRKGSGRDEKFIPEILGKE